MRTTFTITIGIVLLCLFLPTQAKAPLGQPAEDPNIRPPAEQPAPKTYTKRVSIPVDPTPYKEQLRAIASAKGLSEAKVIEIEKTIGGEPGNKVCPNGESGWHEKAVGDNGTSFGLAQIHLPAHPGITREQAEDATFALNFIVDKFIDGKEHLWTCWRALDIIE